MQNISMSVEMTKAILDGRKVQTRRVININPNDSRFDGFDEYEEAQSGNIVAYFYIKDYDDYRAIKPKYQIDETIWAREPAKVILSNNERMIMRYKYLADDFHVTMNIPERFENSNWVWDCQGIPSGCIKEMARIFLKITNVRVERLQQIGWSGIHAEGVVSETQWIELWNKTAAKGCKWEDNPYVFVYEFERVEK